MCAIFFTQSVQIFYAYCLKKSFTNCVHFFYTFFWWSGTGYYLHFLNKIWKFFLIISPILRPVLSWDILILDDFLWFFFANLCSWSKIRKNWSNSENKQYLEKRSNRICFCLLIEYFVCTFKLNKWLIKKNIFYDFGQRDITPFFLTENRHKTAKFHQIFFW